MKTVFMGTPDFAAESLSAVIGAGFEVAAVFTQPDKPKNRGKKIEITPVKELALANNIPVYQPLSLKKGDDGERSLEILREISPDVIVVVAYGQILPKSVLELPGHGCVNLHASLLPKYRGAAPIQRCIEAGETKSGVCTMRMDEGLDTGDVIMRRETDISPETTGSELAKTLCAIGGELLIQTLFALENGTASFTKQEGEACYAEKIDKSELLLDFSKPAAALLNKIRAMADAPCCYTFLEGKRLKIYRAAPSDISSALPVGSVCDEKRLAVVCKDGCIELREVMAEGSKRMSAADFLRGKRIEKGAKLGE